VPPAEGENGAHSDKGVDFQAQAATFDPRGGVQSIGEQRARGPATTPAGTPHGTANGEHGRHAGRGRPRLPARPPRRHPGGSAPGNVHRRQAFRVGDAARASTPRARGPVSRASRFHGTEPPAFRGRGCRASRRGRLSLSSAAEPGWRGGEKRERESGSLDSRAERSGAAAGIRVSSINRSRPGAGARFSHRTARRPRVPDVPTWCPRTGAMVESHQRLLACSTGDTVTMNRSLSQPDGGHSFACSR
jgi:hypothetical protein